MTERIAEGCTEPRGRLAAAAEDSGTLRWLDGKEKETRAQW